MPNSMFLKNYAIREGGVQGVMHVFLFNFFHMSRPIHKIFRIVWFGRSASVGRVNYMNMPKENYSHSFNLKNW